MGTVTIGDRELRVLGKNDRGSFKRDFDLIKLGEEMKGAEGAALQMKFAEMILVYVRDNSPPVTLEWLVENLPADFVTVMRACALASGREPKETSAQGEAARP